MVMTFHKHLASEINKIGRVMCGSLGRHTTATFTSKVNEHEWFIYKRSWLRAQEVVLDSIFSVTRLGASHRFKILMHMLLKHRIHKDHVKKLLEQDFIPHLKRFFENREEEGVFLLTVKHNHEDVYKVKIRF